MAFLEALLTVFFFGKSRSTFNKVSAKNCKNVFIKFFIFFPHKIFFPKSTFEGPGKKLGQFFMNKKVYILTNNKVG